MKIAICDDEILELENIYTLVNKFRLLHREVSISIHRFESALQFLDYIKDGNKFDIYLLDILMPKINGIEIGRQIRMTDSKAVIVYLTSSKDYALEAFGVSAKQYLIKPITPQSLYPIIEDVSKKFENDNAYKLPISTKDGIVTVFYSDIMHVECYNHVLFFHMANGSIVNSTHIRTSFEAAVEPLLQESGFLHPHKSYVVNMQHIRKMNNQEFVMWDGALIPIARKNYSEIKAIYMKFLTEQ